MTLLDNHGCTHFTQDLNTDATRRCENWVGVSKCPNITASVDFVPFLVAVGCCQVAPLDLELHSGQQVKAMSVQ